MGGITDSPLFETAIAMVVVWLAAATLTSGIVELIATALSFRANHLWDWLEGLLTPKDSPAPPATGASGAAKLATASPTVSGSGFIAFVDALPGVTSTALKKVRTINTAAAAQALLI